MQYRFLGRTGLKVSELCLGTMQFGWTADEPTSFEVLSAAYDAGVNFIDTADIYSRWAPGNPGGVAETILGNWMQQNRIPRDRIILATKVRARMGDGPNDEGLSRAHIIKAVEASLKRLQTDYIDLYQSHYYDENTPIEETLAAYDDLVRQGKVRYIGCSNYPAWRLMQSLWAADKQGCARYESLQPHYNLVHRAEFEQELAEVCRVFGLGVIPYSPLAKGFLSGKYRPGSEPVTSQRARGVQNYFTEKNWALLGRMEKLGQEKGGGRKNGGYSISQVALAWLLADPLITSPIIGPRSLEQLQDNLGAGELRLTAEEKEILDEASDWRENQS
jgi:aryl-alcohol dehydrogenase-like predicted oxidoreductase